MRGEGLEGVMVRMLKEEDLPARHRACWRATETVEIMHGEN